MRVVGLVPRVFLRDVRRNALGIIVVAFREVTHGFSLGGEFSGLDAVVGHGSLSFRNQFGVVPSYSSRGVAVDPALLAVVWLVIILTW